MSAHAHRGIDWRREAPGDQVLARELDSGVAGRGSNVRVHVLARGTSSRADPDAGASVGVSHSAECVGTYLAVGSAVERSGIEDQAAITMKRDQSTHKARAKGLICSGHHGVPS